MADRVLTSVVISPQSERRAAVAALTAELGHDLQGPLNFFRLSTERLARGETLDAEDICSLQEELNRLSQLSARLRELSRASRHAIGCSPVEVVRLALSGRPTPPKLELTVAEDLSIRCDPALLGQALRELIDNAVQARASRAGVRFEASGFCVWDDGEGFSVSAERAQAWGVTTRADAAGLGLTVALRAARAHGFTLELRRVPPITEVWLRMPIDAGNQERT